MGKLPWALPTGQAQLANQASRLATPPEFSSDCRHASCSLPGLILPDAVDKRWQAETPLSELKWHTNYLELTMAPMYVIQYVLTE